MSEPKKTNLINIDRRAFMLGSAIALGGAVGISVAFKNSLTDYGNSPAELNRLDFVLFGMSDVEILELHPVEEIERELRIREEEEGLSHLDASKSATLLGWSCRDLDELASTIVTATFVGERKYVHGTFRSTVSVNEVIKGNGINAGDELPVYEAYEIREPGTFYGGYYTEAREMGAAFDDATSFGIAPMRADQKYLFFLEEKEYPEDYMGGNYVQTYCLLPQPYARISLDVAENSERVLVSPIPDEEYARLTFAEASTYDFFVASEKAKQLYLENCAEFLKVVTKS